MKKSIAVIFGGQSSEHEVSCMSVVNVLDNLDKEKYEIHMIGITKEGHWLYVDDIEKIKNKSWYDLAVTAAISPDRKKPGIWKIDGDKHEIIRLDVAFPVLHGRYGEDGTIQGLFELAGIPYVGCGVLASAASADKITTKMFVDTLNIRQADYITDTAADDSRIEDTICEAEKKLSYPMFVKPSNAGSSVGVSKAEDRDGLREAILCAKKHDSRVLIEEMIVGRELECAVLGRKNHAGTDASSIGEVLAAAEFYDYEAKYFNPESRTVVDPEDLPKSVKEEIRKDAVEIFEALGGFGLSRVDFFVEEGTNEVVFNEINTMPGITDISMYPVLCEAMGIGKKELWDRLIALAYER